MTRYSSVSLTVAFSNPVSSSYTSSINDDAEEDDWFGKSLASGDYNGDGRDDLAIGIPGEDLGSITNAGAVDLIFGASRGLSAAGDKWITQSGAVAGNVTRNANFGNTLASGQMKMGYREELAVGTKLTDTTTSASTIVTGSLTLERLNQIRSYGIISFDPSSSVKKMARNNPHVPIGSITLNL